jgi:DNA-binding protein H-NS
VANTSLDKLVAQREELDRQIETIKQQERQQVIAQVREQMALYGIKPEDLRLRRRKQRSDIGVPRKKGVKKVIARKKPGRKAAAKQEAA